jgi:hypothetical protein
MLCRGNKLFIMLLLVTTVVSCNRYKEYNVKEIQEIRNNAISMSKFMLGEKEYDWIYKNMNDSISHWMNNRLGNYASWNSVINYQVDSVLCVNKARNKIVTGVLLPYVGEGGVSDEVTYFYGVKIKEVWYFFRGAGLVLPREYYQKDIHTPLSFEKLKQITTSNIYRRYLKKNKQGEWEVNERFFSGMSNKNMTVSGYGGCFDCKTEEEYYMHLVKRNWSRKK